MPKEPTPTSEFGPLLRKHRKKAKYSIAGLAGLLGIKPSELSAIERGESLLTNEQIVKAASIFRTDLKPLLAAAKRDLDAAFRRQWPGM